VLFPAGIHARVAGFSEDQISVKFGLTASALACLLAFGSGLSAQSPQQQQPVPDAPTPQAPPPLPGAGTVRPGEGAAPVPQADSGSAASSAGAGDQPAPGEPGAPANTPQPPAQQEKPVQSQQPVQPQQPFDQPVPESSATQLPNFVIRVNFVQVPVTVKDTKGRQVPGLSFRDFRVFENGTREPIAFFNVDPQPLAIAFVIDQSLPSNVMDKVNASMGAIQGALTSYDSAAVFTYGNGAKQWTGFTGGQSARLPAVLSLAKSAGTDPQVPINGGPFSNCPIYVNGNCADPVLQTGGSTGNGQFSNIPKEIHTLNDAILAAAQQLSTQPKDFRRVIYVISDGKEYGSKATWKEVVRYLETNKTTVYATLVGDSARWGEGWIDRFHLPFEMYDNILYKYTLATGGDTDSEGGVNGIETSYQKIAGEARNQYTLGYFTTRPPEDDRYRNIDVRVDRPNLEVIAKHGYYPSVQDR
jgi:VWFA-related protein